MDVRRVHVPARNYAKPFAIGGFIVGEIIMVLTVLAPNQKGLPSPPIDAQIMRVLVGSLFFGPFGMAAGTGLGLLYSGLVSRFRRPVALRGPLESDSQPAREGG